MKKFLKSNLMVWIYFGLALLIELVAVFVTSDKFYIRSPWIFLLVQLVMMLILLTIPSNKARHITASIMLSVFMIVDLVFIVIFEMTETIFDYGMLNLRNDGMAILESVPINFAFFSISMLAIALYIVFGWRYAKNAEKPVSIKLISIPTLLVAVVGLGTVLYVNNRNFEQNVQDKLYRSSEASYCEYGIVGNFLNEFVKGMFFTKVDLGDEQELEDFIYSTDNIYTSNFNDEEYNVVSILVESFEWHSFVRDFNLYSNGHNINYARYGYTSAEEVLRDLFPNIYDFYDTGIALTNYYSREKTDISENLTLMGSYPTNAYINYDFPDNTMSTSFASVLKTLYGDDITCNYFHNGGSTFYNRSVEIISAGFDSFTATSEMKKMGMTDYSAKGERNLDADMIDVCQDQMFPTDKRFYTYITTITMHGQYTYRDNLEERGYYKEFADVGFYAKDDDDFASFNYNNFYYYCACVKEFDRALGRIIEELTERTNSAGERLIDNTVICLYGDHNTYYSSLSNYVKDIDNTQDENYTNLYRVPCMIKCPNITAAKDYLTDGTNGLLAQFKAEVREEYPTMSEEEVATKAQAMLDSRYVISDNQIICKKFACTADVLPTLFDLCGINVYGNLYFGHSIFSKDVSVLYSRAYDMFITDNMYFVSLNNIKYMRKDGVNAENSYANTYADLYDYDKEDYLVQVETEAKILLKKLSVCNRIFYNDYFARKNINDNSKTNAQIFAEKLREIN